MDLDENRTAFFSLLSIGVGLVLGLVGLEFSLRLASQLNKEISIPPRQPREIRIVTIGESTTESFGKGHWRTFTLNMNTLESKFWHILNFGD